jgi:putative ABC transport system ATP-binding protein
MSYIQIDHLTKQYGDGEAAVLAVRGIHFDIASGEWIAIMGESGSGKSTLLTVMGALNSPSQGKYRVDHIDVYALGQEERADFRRNTLGFVFQSFHLIPYLTVRENVMLPLTPVRIREKEKRVRAEEALGRVGLTGKGHRLPSQISGGEQERVAIARALVNKPPILLADEPTGNLDTKTTREVMNLLKEVNSDGMTLIMVTHNPECAQYARRTLRLSDGVLVKEETKGIGDEGGEKQSGICYPRPRDHAFQRRQAGVIMAG